MSDVPMPRDLSEEAVARWLHDIAAGSNPGMQVALRARAVRSLVEQKVREAIPLARDGYYVDGFYDKGGFIGARRVMLPNDDAIVARVLGDHPSNASGGHDEGRPARGEVTRG